jgi:Flp pilus assembly protein, secretin CpaC
VKIKFLIAAALTGALGCMGRVSAEPVVQISVSESGKTAVTKKILLPMHKSSVVELNLPAADVIITNPKIADAVVRTPQRVIFRGVSTGETNAFFFDANGNQLLDLQIKVERDLTALVDLYKRLLPNARIKPEGSNGSIILTGRVANLSEASTAVELANNFISSGDTGGGNAASGGTATTSTAGGQNEASAGKVINMLTVEGKDQVLLKVRIVEMQRTLTKQLGVNLSGSKDVGNNGDSLIDNVTFSTSNAFQRSRSGAGRFVSVCGFV